MKHISRSRTSWLCLVLATSILSVPTRGAESETLLSHTLLPWTRGLDAAEASLLERTARIEFEDPMIRRSRHVRLDLRALRSGSTFDLELFDGEVYTVSNVRLERRGPNSFSWLGRIEEVEGARLLLAVHDGVLAGYVWLRGRALQLRWLGRDDLYSLRELGSIEGSLEHDVAIPPPPASAMVPASGDRRLPSSPLSPKAALANVPPLIDVLVAYTQRVFEDPYVGNGSLETMTAEAQLAVDVTNQIYADSGVDQRLRLAGLLATAYEESGDLTLDIARLHDPEKCPTGDTGCQQAVAIIHRQRDDVGADIVSLWLGRAEGTALGYGSLLSGAYLDPGADFSPFAFNVLLARSLFPCLVFSHELGHNMGVQHDRLDEPDPGAFSYSHGYVEPAEEFATVMAAGRYCRTGGGADPVPYNIRIPRFSNPRQTWQGAPLGLPEGDPDSADAARTLNETAAVVSGFRPSPVALWVDPLDGLVSSGAPFAPIGETYFLTNTGSSDLDYEVSVDQPWLALLGLTGPATDLLAGTLVESDQTAVLAFLDLFETFKLSPGEYTGSVWFRNQTTGIGDALRDVTLTVEGLEVDRPEAFVSTGRPGTSFFPTTRNYRLTNRSDAPLTYSVHASEAWIRVDSGRTLDPGQEFGSLVRIVREVASQLDPGTYDGSVTWVNETDGRGTQSRTVTLEVGAPLLAVSPVDGFEAAGPAGGAFSPTFKEYVLTNTDDAPLDWQADALVTNATDDFWALDGGPSLSGTLQPGGQTTLRVLLTAAADLLPAGSYGGTLEVRDTSANPDLTTSLPVSLTVAGLAITPLTGLEASGPEGGVFVPGSQVYTVTNTGSGLICYDVSATGWLFVQPSGARCKSPGFPTEHTVSFATFAAANLPPGTHVGVVTFENLTDGTTTTRQVVLEVERPPDRDQDGIANEVDPQPVSYSSVYSDVSRSGQTTGTILDRGGQVLLVRNAVNPTHGITASALGAAGAIPAHLETCSGSDRVDTFLGSGESVTVTCSNSFTVRSLEGTVGIAFEMQNQLGTLDLPENNTLTVDPPTGSISTPAGNPDPLLLRVKGREILLAPGSNLTLDVGPPEIVPPSDVVAEATGPATPIALGSPVVTDAIDPSPQVTNDAPATFPLGVTRVTWTATDSSDNRATAVQVVQVRDTTPPSLTLPPPATLECPQPGGAPLTTPPIESFLAAATASDLVDPEPTIQHDAAPVFELGTTAVTFVATDESGNTTSAASTVTVDDSLAPAVSVARTTAEVGESFVPVSEAELLGLFGFAASDLCDPAPDTSATPTGPFAEGETATLRLAATDAAGNTASVDVRLSVVGASATIFADGFETGGTSAWSTVP